MSEPKSAWHVALLPDRGVVEITGDDAEKLLQGLITNDVTKLSVGDAAYAGLLSPQGKIAFDFFVIRIAASTFLIDVARDHAASLAQRLNLYKLRSNATITNRSADYTVSAIWGDGDLAHAKPQNAIAFIDPRNAALGLRVLLTLANDWVPGELNAQPLSATAYHAHRIASGVPEGARDFKLGDAFPHEALFDQVHGVDFEKGCYVGQEVVSRMQHRGTARKRIVQVTGDTALPPSGSEIKAGSATIGTLGSIDGANGLALVRLDRVAEALSKGDALTADGIQITVTVQPWATFTLPAGSNNKAENNPPS